MNFLRKTPNQASINTFLWLSFLVVLLLADLQVGNFYNYFYQVIRIMGKANGEVAKKKKKEKK